MSDLMATALARLSQTRNCVFKVGVVLSVPPGPLVVEVDGGSVQVSGYVVPVVSVGDTVLILSDGATMAIIGEFVQT